MVFVPVIVMLEGWCKVFHQSTENFIIGMFIAPITIKDVEILLFKTHIFYQFYRKNIRCIKKIIKIIIEVSLASQAHQVPQVGFPQIDPVTTAKQVKNKPIGAILLLIIKKIFYFKNEIKN